MKTIHLYTSILQVSLLTLTKACSNILDHFVVNNFDDFPDIQAYPITNYKIKIKEKKDGARAAIFCKKTDRGAPIEDKAAFRSWKIMESSGERRGVYNCVDGTWVMDSPPPACPDPKDVGAWAGFYAVPEFLNHLTLPQNNAMAEISGPPTYTKVNWIVGLMEVQYPTYPVALGSCQGCPISVTGTTEEEITAQILDICSTWDFTVPDPVNYQYYDPDYIAYFEDQDWYCAGVFFDMDTVRAYLEGTTFAIGIQVFSKAVGPLAYSQGGDIQTFILDDVIEEFDLSADMVDGTQIAFWHENYNCAYLTLWLGSYTYEYESIWAESNCNSFNELKESMGRSNMPMSDEQVLENRENYSKRVEALSNPVMHSP